MSPHGARAMGYMASSLAVGLWAHPAERWESREPPFLGLDRTDGSSGLQEGTRTALGGLAFIVVWGIQRPGPAWASQDEGPGMPKDRRGRGDDGKSHLSSTLSVWPLEAVEPSDSEMCARPQ